MDTLLERSCDVMHTTSPIASILIVPTYSTLTVLSVSHTCLTLLSTQPEEGDTHYSILSKRRIKPE
jgi:hypothetical protein